MLTGTVCDSLCLCAFWDPSQDDQVRKVGLSRYSRVSRTAFGLNGKKRIAVLRAGGAILGEWVLAVVPLCFLLCPNPFPMSLNAREVAGCLVPLCVGTAFVCQFVRSAATPDTPAAPVTLCPPPPRRQGWRRWWLWHHHS